MGTKSLVNAPDAAECVLVRELVNTLHRLDPVTHPLPKGRVEFKVRGVKLPPTVHMSLDFKLSDKSITNPNEGLPHNLPRLVPLRQDQPCSVTVLDGTYRLHKNMSFNLNWDVDSERIGRLIQLDFPDWPDDIDVRGNTVTLAPLTLRLAEAIEPNSPEDGEALDLSEAELRWSAIPNANLYRVHLWARQNSPRPSASLFHTMEVTNPQLRFDSIDENGTKLVRQNLVQGTICEWQVHAYDAEKQVHRKDPQE